MNFILRRTWVRWTVSVAMVLLAAVINIPIQQLTAGRGPLLPFFPALLLVGFMAGAWPGCLSLLLSILCLRYFWTEPAGSFIVSRPTDSVLLGLYMLSGLLAVVLAGHARRVILEQHYTRRRMQLALRAGKMTAWEWNLATGGIDFSDGAEDLLGKRCAHVDDVWPMSHPDDAQRIRTHIDEALASGRQYSFVSRMHRGDTAELRWVETHGYVHRNARGVARRVSGVTIDVTERQQALDASRAAEHRFKVALQGSGIVAWQCDSHLRYTWLYNPPFGLDATAFIGEKIGAQVPREDILPFMDAVERVLRTGQGEHLPIWARHGGQVRHYLSNIEALKDEAGRVTGLIGASMDITELRQTEEALDQSMRVYRMLGEAVPDFVWAISSEHRVLHINRRWSEYTGISIEALNERGFDDRIHPEDRPAMERSWAEAQAQDRPWEVEYRYRRHDGAYRWFWARAVAVRDQQGRLLQWVGTSTDIHDRREAQRALERESRRKDEFLATLAHELRNPMAPIRYALTLLKDDAPAAAREHARNVIERQSAHMARLLDDLLDMSRITRNAIQLRTDTLDLRELASQVVEASQGGVSAARHQLELRLPDEPVWILADSTRIAQVLGNLIDNAAKYTEPGGHITVRVERAGEEALAVVEDTGQGLDPDACEEIFELFTQVHQQQPGARTSGAGGLGIGLAVVRQLVELHGGRVRAYSAGRGQGSRFSVHLPQQASPSATASAPTEVEPALAAQGIRVLIVDDNTDAADTLAILLETEGCRARVAYSGLEALQVFREMAAGEGPPRAVFLDVGLPDLSGHDVAMALRAEPSAGALALIAVTGWGQAEDRARSQAAGFDAHLVKPVDADLLSRTLRSVIGATSGL